TGGIIKNALAADTTFWIEKGLSANTTRWVYVEAYNFISSSASPSPTVYTLAQIPAVSGFSDVWYTSATVTIAANGNPDGTEYYVECDTAADFTTPDNSGWGVMASTQFAGLSDDTTYYFQVKARNGDLEETVFGVYDSTVTQYIDDVTPTVGITEPVDTSYTNDLPQIQGTCNDDVAVSTVAIRIYNQTNAVYWTHPSGPWDATAEAAWFAPSLSSGASFWWFNSPGWEDAKVYEINVKAEDTSGNWSTVYSTNTFTYDITAPVSVTTAPANGKTLATLTHIGGTAMDALSGVTVVKVNICDLTEGATYWNGSGWGETSYWLNVSFAADWSYSFLDSDWTEGHVYRIRSQATDDAVNIESAVNESTFTFSKTGVKLQILLPGETATPGIAPGKTGTPSAQTAGVAFSVTVNAVDDLWNIAANAVATSQLTTTDPNDSEPASIALTNGATVFSLTMVTAGTATITAADTDGTPLPSDTSSEVTINPNAATKLQVLVPGEAAAAGTGGGKTGVPDTQYAGGVFTVTVNTCDDYWNVVSSSPTVNVTTSDSADIDPGDFTLIGGATYFQVTLITPSTGTTIKAEDVDGTPPYYSGNTSAYIVVSSTDTVPPTVGITEPMDAYTNSVAKIAGTANDNVAVSSVSLWIEREDTFVWDGGTWTGAGVWIDADNVHVSSWSYTTAVPWHDGISYDIIVKAKDSNDNWSTVYDTVTFTYDISLPTSTVTYPVESGQYTDITGITGISTDTVSGVWATKIKIFALSGPYIGAWWQDGSGWQGAEFWNDASGTDSWSFDTSMIGWSTGTYNVQPKVQDVAGSWEIPVSSVTFTILASTPAAPAGFNGTAQSAGAINWIWEDVSSEEDYKIKTATGGLIAVRPPGTTFYIETGLSVNTSYQRYVEAYNAGGSSASVAAVKYTLAYPPLTTAVVASSTGSVSITWQNNSNPSGTRWGIERSTYSDFFETWVISTFVSDYTAIGYTDTGLEDDTTYYYRVRAYNGDAVVTAFDSTVSTRTALAPDVTAPSALSDLTAVSGAADGEIDLSWTAPGDDGETVTLEGLYRIDYATYTKSWLYTDYNIEFAATGSAPGTSLARNVSGLDAGATYYFAMWSADEVPNWSSVSNAASSLAQLIISTPSAPTVFSGAAQDSASIMWSWTDNSGNEDGFYLKNSSDVIVNTITANTTFYLETGLGVNSETYRYLVSYNGAGENSSIPAMIYTLANALPGFS
ncbi:MAG: fibronectin type III domain-containing protein, partial [Deltaproteobacteria bacterium]|nr:fibronectin type III domain-containing protein [Deltaproteobacteria bacterium]